MFGNYDGYKIFHNFLEFSKKKKNITTLQIYKISEYSNGIIIAKQMCNPETQCALSVIVIPAAKSAQVIARATSLIYRQEVAQDVH